MFGWSGRAGVVPLVVALFSGCAISRTYPPPTGAQLADAEGRVKAAREGGAAETAQAARHLRMAEQQLALAKEKAAAADNWSASMLLARADADAEVGQMLSRKHRAVHQAAVTEQQLAETRGEAATPATTAPAIPPAADPAAVR